MTELEQAKVKDYVESAVKTGATIGQIVGRLKSALTLATDANTMLQCGMVDQAHTALEMLGPTIAHARCVVDEAIGALLTTKGKAPK